MKPMTADELKSAGRELFGHGWQTRLAEHLGVDGSTVRRWVSGAVPVPNPAAAAIHAFLRIRKLTNEGPPRFR
jgi:DNA-binding transcriptional regulator YdaS (Cro superfamily)